MEAKQVIILARKHVGENGSARLCLADAVALYDRGDFDHAKQRAIKSLGYSVGVFHADYKEAAK